MKDDLKEIKERLLEEDKVELLLEELGCNYIKKRGSRWEAQLPERFGSGNERAVQVYDNESLSSFVRNKGFKGDIYGLVAFLEYDIDDFDLVREKIFQIKTFVCNLFGYEEYLEKGDDFEEKGTHDDYLFFLRGVQKDRKRRERAKSMTNKENEVISDIKLSRFIHYPHYEFLKDGINVDTQNEFGVCFDPISERVVYPVHNKDGQLIGTKGRYVGDNKRILNRIKYIYLSPCDKSIELFNYHRAYNSIINKQEVIVFESAKSCMLAHQYGWKNTVSIEGSELSPVQAHLLKSLGVIIIFAFDKDMSEEVVLKNTRQIKNRVKKQIIDDIDSLGEKDAPIDAGLEVWENLYRNAKLLK